MTFNEIIKANPASGELAMEIVFERLTGKCWHEKVMRTSMDGFHHPESHCGKCGAHVLASVRVQIPTCPSNPDLLHSLDAWIPLWERMSGSLIHQHQEHVWAIQLVEAGYKTIGVKTKIIRPALAHHHLEAALLTLEGECGEKYCSERVNVVPEGYPNPCTCTNGKVSLMTIWERKVSQ